MLKRVFPSSVIAIGLFLASQQVVAQSVAAAVRSDSLAVVGGVLFLQQGVMRVPPDSAGELRPYNREEIQVPALAAGAYDAAPWLGRLGGPTGGGRILRTTDIPGVAMGVEERTQFLHGDRLYVVPPPGVMAYVGQRLLAVTRGAPVGDDLEVVVPGAILTVEVAGATGEASIARITRQFAPVMSHSTLVSYEPPPAIRAGAPTPVSGGATGKVVWVEMSSSLPTLQARVIVSIGSADGVRVGDVFSIIRPREVTPDGIAVPEQLIANARVARVSEQGSTLLITHQAQAGIKVGSAVRLTARM